MICRAFVELEMNESESYNENGGHSNDWVHATRSMVKWSIKVGIQFAQTNVQNLPLVCLNIGPKHLETPLLATMIMIYIFREIWI